MPTITAKELKVLRDKAAVLDYIAAQSVGNMSSLVMAWYPTPPPKVPYPTCEPFTAPKKCNCDALDIMGFLHAGEHFPSCTLYVNGSGPWTDLEKTLFRRIKP